MDSYDLFGEDGGSSMLDGLTDFGGDNLDPTAGTRDSSSSGYVSQQQQSSYGQPLSQESPLQKLASFGGDFSHMDPSQQTQQTQQQQQQQGMYHQSHPSYGSPARPSGYQSHMRSMPSHRPPHPGSTQYTPYSPMPENMYGMERQQSNLQGWNGASNYPGSMRHYSGQINQGQSSYRQHVGYPQQEKISQQYPSSQMMGYQQYPPPNSHYTSGSYDSYGRLSHHNPYQQSSPQSPQYPHTQQSQYGSSGSQPYTQMMGYHQQSSQQQQQHQSVPRASSGSDVTSYGGQKPVPPAGITSGSSPQYRAPFPQLSPQISPRPQMSPRPQPPPPPSSQQMSPRPVMSPAKPSTLSPHPLTPKSSTSSPAPSFPPQSTLQQLEQMVPPYQSRNQQSRVPLSPQHWSQQSSVDQQLQSHQDSLFHPMSTSEEAVPSSTLEPSETNKSSGIEAHSSNSDNISTLVDNSCVSPNESTGPTSTVESKAPDTKCKQSHSNLPHTSPMHSQGQLPSASPHQSHNSPQVSQGLSPHPSHTSPHPSHSSPHPSHPSPHPSLSSPHLSPGQPLQSPHPTTTQPLTPQVPPSPHHTPQTLPPPGSKVASQSPSHQSMKQQPPATTDLDLNTNSQGSLDVDRSTHSMMSPTQHLLSGGTQQQQQLRLSQSGLDQSNATHSLHHMSGHTQRSQQQHLLQQQQQQQAQPRMNLPPHMAPGHTHISQTNRYADFSGSQYSSSKLEDMMGTGMESSRQFDVDPATNRMISGRMMGIDPSMMGMSSQQQAQIDPTSMRMMSGRSMPPSQQSNMYNPPSTNSIMSGGTMMGMDMFSHQQEMAALQQQVQELYCMPPAPMNQEKMSQLEERLRTLQQHEAATQCQGGPLCVLPGPMFGASLIQGSPQVTSTTGRGRGRGRGPAKPRKTKKQKLAEQQQQQLMEQQQLMMQQQQFRQQMSYPSKGLPHEMNPMMAPGMGNIPGMGMMGGSMTPSGPAGGLPPNMNPNTVMSPTPSMGTPMNPNMMSGIMPNPTMSQTASLSQQHGPAMMSGMQANPNLGMQMPGMGGSMSNVLSQNMGMSMGGGNTSMLQNPNLQGMPAMPGMPCTPSMNMNQQQSSGMTMVPQLPNQGMGITQQGVPPLQQPVMPPAVQQPLPSHMSVPSMNTPPQSMSMGALLQQPQPPLGGHNTSAQPGTGQVPPTPLTYSSPLDPTVTPPPPQPPPCPPLPQHQLQQQQPPPQQPLHQPMLQTRIEEKEATPPFELENKIMCDDTNNSNPPTSTLNENTNSNHSEMNTTCDVDSSTNPEVYVSAQQQYHPIYDKKNYSREVESDVDPYLMTDESLGGEVIQKKIRRQRKPREPKLPKPPKEPRSRKSRGQKTQRDESITAYDESPPPPAPKPRRRRDSRRDGKEPRRRSSKKRSVGDFSAEEWEVIEQDERMLSSYEQVDEFGQGVFEDTPVVENSLPTSVPPPSPPPAIVDDATLEEGEPEADRDETPVPEQESQLEPEEEMESELETAGEAAPVTTPAQPEEGEEHLEEEEEEEQETVANPVADPEPDQEVDPQSVSEVREPSPSPVEQTRAVTPSQDTPGSSSVVETTPKKRGRRKDPNKPAIALKIKRSSIQAPVKRSRGSGTGGRKKKVVVEESDGEDGIIATPPPSPEEDVDNSNKRRSARNTQRKKYCDDIMLSISDEEAPKSPDTDSKPFAAKAGPVVKPNFVYVNTTDEDSMVVQYILAVRKGRREVKVEPPKPEADEVKNEETSKEVKVEPGDDKEKKPDETEDMEVDVSDEKKETVEKKQRGDGESDDVDENKKDKEPVDNAGCSAAAVTKVEGDLKPVESTFVKSDHGDAKTEVIEVDEYFVKYRNFSYLHCEWKTEDELRRGDRRTFSKIKRFQQKMANNMNIFEYLEDEPFNPDFVEIDRVLDVAEHSDPSTNSTVKHYLVKWRSIQYEDSTWELEVDVDPMAIKQFERFRKIPTKDKLRYKKRPNPDSWRKLDKSPDYKNNNTLRLYQLEGLNWLLFSWHNGRNCILADEMGLGKTIQSLAFINSVYEYGVRGPFLVIAPLSTIPNWQREFEAWTDLNVIVYHGSAASLQMLQEYEFFFKNDKGTLMKEAHKFNVLITTFELIITHSQELKGFNWRICIIDEAHRLKNRNCKLLEGLRMLNMEHRVLLSGTPLQNNVNELFSLLNFLEPSQFTSGEAFLQEFGALKTEQEVNKLQALLKPMMLRRMKEDVEKSLAPKEETIVEVELTNIQKKYYRGILERNFSFLSKGTSSSNIPNLMNTMMELRKCCIHPYLLNGAEEQIQIDYKNVHGEDAQAYYKALIHSSGKMVLVDKLLPKLKANGHRVLVFSQMVKCLDIIEDYLLYRKYTYERIDGRIRGDLRQAAIDRFCRPDSDRFVFLLCTKAGGLGINLTAADTVIIYDSDWNPQNDLQAQARCHRIGQQKMVKVYRLICRNTYEREMFDKASLKLGLDKAVLQSMNTAQGGKDPTQKQLSKKEIEDLLKRGAYGAIMGEDSAGDKFCEEDIDQILERRTQVITLESEQGSTFSKASFASSGIRSDINIDDPDFWKKWAKKADIDTKEKPENEKLLVSEPRRRTQIKRYGQDDATLDMSDLGESSGPSAESDDDTSLGVGRGRGKKSKLKKKKKHQHHHHYHYDEYGHRESEIIPYGSWTRSECFKVEKGLLTFGWDRWPEIMYTTQFRKGWGMMTVEDCARVILVYCLRYYRGDEKIRHFIWDLITPNENGANIIGKNHHGLSAPVPRGRNLTRSKKLGKDKKGYYETDHWSNSDKYDGEIILESNYKKHLSRHANKVLLRVRLLYYIKHEIVGDLFQQINEGVHASVLPIHPPPCDLAPAPWWDAEADKSLLIGTFKHGYENYPAMRNDPTLGFLTIVGPDTPEDRPIVLDDTEEDTMEGDNMTMNESSCNINEDSSSTAVDTASSNMPDTIGESVSTPVPSESNDDAKSTTTETKQDGKLEWPTIGDLNTRLRRVITSYQKNFRKEEMKLQQKAKIERREKIEQIVREREKMRLEISQKKWSRREETDFYRTIAVFGVEYDKSRKQYDWTKFRALARLDKKTDDSMTEYYNAFYTMLKRSCGLKITEEEECQDFIVELLSEEKAKKTLETIELLSKIREEIIHHPRLDQRLKLCKMSADLPDWWVPGKHDKDLLFGVAKHGLGRTDFYLLNDPELSFKDVVKLSMVEDPAMFLREKFAESFKEQVRITKEEKTLKKEPVSATIIKIETDEPVSTKPEVDSKSAREEDKEKKTIEETQSTAAGEEGQVKPVEDANMSDEETPLDKLATKSVKTKKSIVITKKNKTESKQEVEKMVDESIYDFDEEAEGVDDVQKKKLREDDAAADNDVEDEVDEDCRDDRDDVSVECKTENDEETPAPPVADTVTDDKEGQKEANVKPEPDSEEGKEQNIEKKDSKEEDEIVVEVKEEASEHSKESPVEDKKEEVQLEESPAQGEVKDVPEEEKETQPDDADTVVEEVKKPKQEITKRIEDLKPAFSELDILQPWSRLPEIDAFLWRDRSSPVSEPTLAQLIAHSYQNPIKWPRDLALLVRLQHIIHAIEYKEWPFPTDFSVFTVCGGLDVSARNTPEVTSKRDSSTPMSVSEGSEVITITTEMNKIHSSSSKKKKHHIAIDVETERAKLHALLNSTVLNQPSQSSSTLNLKLPMWEATDESLSEDSRRSTPVSLQPPPAHQQTATRVPPFDINKFHPVKQLSSVSSMAPMDLSAGCSKSHNNNNEVQDLSMAHDLSAKKSSSALTGSSQSSVAPHKSKLDNMLDKLLKRKNCPPEEPIVEKEKKRRKLDEIVLGLSAAKEQQTTSSLLSDLKKSSSISPSVTVTPANMHPPPSSTPAAKPFTITVTSVPASSASSDNKSSDRHKSADSLSSFLNQSEQQHGKLLLKQQQQLLQQQQNLLQHQALSSLTSPTSSSRKSYEAMVADLSKVGDFSKIGSYSHEAKVNKWLAEQTALMSPDQSLSSDYLARRRRPRLDPTLLDWKKLTGDENVSVINRSTGKKVTGSKAPSLKRLAQWLMENPMYDVDPKWAELVKERGNLPHELQKRLPGVDRKSKSASSSRPVLSSPPEPSSSSVSVSQSNLVTSMASSLPFPSLAGLPSPGLLSGLTLGGFDPKNPLFDVKNNPLLDPKNSSLFDPKNNPLLDPKNNPLLDPKNSSLFDPKNLSLFDPKNNPLFDAKNPLFDPKSSSLFDAKNSLFDPKNNPLLDPKNSSLFDPKNNPLLLPFGGLPNLGALGNMGHLGNPMSVFANLASLGIPSIPGLDHSAGSTTSLPTDQASPGKNKSRKGGNSSESDRHVAKTPPTGGLPFYFPNPSLLYSPLGLGGLNPFSLPPGSLSSAYDSLAQQCGLLNGVPTTVSTTRSGKSQSSTVTTASATKSTPSASSSSHRHHRSTRDQSQLHLLLPHDAHLLESLGRSSSMDMTLKKTKEDKKESDRSEKRQRESSGDFSARTEERPPSSKRSRLEFDRNDPLSAQSLLMSSLSEMDDRLFRRLREPEMKDALEALSRTSAEYITKSLSDSSKHSRELLAECRDIANLNMSELISRSIDEHDLKRSREHAMKEALALSGTSMTELPRHPEPETSKKHSRSSAVDNSEPPVEELTKKKSKEKTNVVVDNNTSSEKQVSSPTTDDPNVDIEDLLPPVTVSRASGGVVVEHQQQQQQQLDEATDSGADNAQAGESADGTKKGRRNRGGKKQRTKSDVEEPPVVERKNLRSSAGRAARAAAERAAAAAAAAAGTDDDEQSKAE